jgi:hypothetical protein
MTMTVHVRIATRKGGSRAPSQLSHLPNKLQKQVPLTATDHVIALKTLSLPLDKLMLATLAGLPQDEER